MVGLISLIAAVLAFCLIVLVLAFMQRDKLRIRARLEAMAAPAQAARERKARPGRERSSRVGGQLAGQLESAGILLRADEFVLIWVCVTVAPAGLLLFFKANPVTAFAVAAAGAVLPPILVSMARRKRLMLFDKQLGDALGIIGNSLRAGFTFQQAMDSIASEMPDPIGKEFAKALREMRLGVPVETALDNMVRRMNNPDLEMLVTAVLIQRQVGGNLAEVIDSIAVTIKDRLKIKGDVRVLTASGRMSGTVIGLMPVFISLILMFTNPTYIMTFFNTFIGIIMLCVAVVMETIGFLIVTKIVNIKY